MIEKQFLDFITQGLYKQADKLVMHLNKVQYKDFIFDCGLKNPSVALYAYLCFKLHNNETAENHYLTARVLVHGLTLLEGVYSAALFHMRRTIELDPHNVEYKREILFFYGTPDNVLSAEEASVIARGLLQNDPQDKAAIETLQRIEWSKERSKNIKE